MKNFKYLLIILFHNITYGQEEVIFKYYLYVQDFNTVHEFQKDDDTGIMKYKGKKEGDQIFFDKFEIKEFRQAFTDGIDPNVLNIFYLETFNENFIIQLIENYPSIYKSFDNVTNWRTESLYYPNDYGTTSPNPNLGYNFNRVEYDYINVADAWDITTGNENIKIGISDTPIKTDDPDFIGKVTNIDGYSPPSSGSPHGTKVAAIAAARGNNAYGSAGICMNCNIVQSHSGVGPTEPDITFSNLYKMAKKGAKVINMSWFTGTYYNNDYNGLLAEQLVISDLVNNYRVTMVAAAGNRPSFGTPESNIYGPPYGIIYVYPASYDDVISVSSISHVPYTLPLTTSQSTYLATSPWFPVYSYLENSVGLNSDGSDMWNPIAVKRTGWPSTALPNNPDGFYINPTLNDKVDIMAPGNNVYSHYGVVYPSTYNITDSGTSLASPAVAGTIGLMYTVDNCLHPNEIETILKITSYDIEALAINQNYIGYMGAGKLEVANAVNFVNEMKKVDGNSIISNHIFKRFNFVLERINNILTLQNISLLEANVSQFTARNEIIIDTNTIISPNSSGSCDLKIKNDLDITCEPIVFEREQNDKNKNDKNKLNNIKPIIYPNPNTGVFDIQFPSIIESCNLEIYDINGRLVFTKKFEDNNSLNLNVDVSNLKSGVYIAKIINSKFTESIKFIKK